MWQLQYEESALKALEKLDKPTVRKIIAYLEMKVLNNPTDFGKPLEYEFKGLWRYRVGDYRIICKIQKQELIVLVIGVGHRKEIYGA